MLDALEQVGKRPIDRTTDGGKALERRVAEAFAQGLTDGRTAIRDQMAPKTGERSRTLKKNVVKESLGGTDAWKVLKKRAKQLPS